MDPTRKPTTEPIPDPAMNPAALLRGAVIYLKAYGWTKGQFFEPVDHTTQPFPPACASGAIMTAAHGYCPYNGLIGDTDDPTTEVAAAMAAMRVFADHLDGGYVPTAAFPVSSIDVIGDWNDDQGRTLDEVVEALTDAAHDWEVAHPAGGAR